MALAVSGEVGFDKRLRTEHGSIGEVTHPTAQHGGEGQAAFLLQDFSKAAGAMTWACLLVVVPVPMRTSWSLRQASASGPLV